MAIYVWEAETRNGEVRKGEIEALNESAVRGQLRRQGLKPVRVKAKPKDILESIPIFKGKVKDKSVVIFARQFSTMISAGLPLIQCLEILATQEGNNTFKKVIKSIKDDIEGGATLTDALKKHPKVFDELFVNMVAAGEAGGILDTILNRLAAYMEKMLKLKSKVKGAMVYPATIVLISFGVITMLLLKVVPVFQKLFSGMGQDLPFATQLLIDLSDFVSRSFIYIIASIVIGVVVFIRYYRTESGRMTVDRFVLRSPIFGPLMRKVAISKFTRTLSTMMSSGVPILDGLEIVSKTAGNRVVEKALLETRKNIREGKTIAEPLQETKVFPPMVVQMIAVGEATGALDSMLSKIADFYEDEVDQAVSAMTSLLEPIMMVFLGGIVGGMIVAMYLPIFQIGALVGH
ncbi:MAG TPA: type II secretion system F family protein [Syntrophales bacterium]|nr:type II secretion system F family protein [Syntrophales bacterium]HPI57357.1 type II secretion system F family protein [Syntrophales bacterium]HPN25421.1 type II secretion system F family protein [Syntrophales bacterium]HQM29903.1 type II secretion system F family protein [Syntrophales bacterium]